MGRGADTRWLTETSFQPAAASRLRWQWLAVAAIAVLALGLLASPAQRMLAAADALGAARDREAALTAEVERLQTRLAVEEAMRRELEQQAAESNTRVAELTAQVDFLRSRKN